MENYEISEYADLIEATVPTTIAATVPTTIAATSVDTVSISTAGKVDINFDAIFEQNCMQRLTVDHKVSEQEFITMKETNPAFADEIKESIARELSSEIFKRTTYTKRKDKDLDVHHFIGRVWVFTDSELKDFIREMKNVR